MVAITGRTGVGSVNATKEACAIPISSVAPVSLDGAVTPPAIQVVDDNSDVWTIDSVNRVNKNGIPQSTGSPNPIQSILWFGGTIYAFNGTNWYQEGAPWTNIGTADPRVSPDLTTIPPATQIIDASLNQWTVVGGVVQLNGSNAAFTASVVQMLYYAGGIYQQNSAGAWFVWNGTGWNATTDPRNPAPKLFYGVNIHPAGGNGAQYTALGHAKVISIMKDIGFTVARMDSNSGNVAAITSWAKDLSAAGITPLIILQGNWISGDETTSYNNGHALGVNVATACQNYTRYYELGNELDDPGRVGRIGDFLQPQCCTNQPAWIGQRGMMRGAYDGVKSVQPNAFCISQGAEVLDKGYIDGMSQGIQPDLTTGHPIVQSDGIGWHWYQSSGNPENTGSSHTAAPCGLPNGGANMLDFVGHYPRGNTIGGFWTEFGNTGQDTEAQQNAWYQSSTSISLMYSKRAQYNITCVCLYQLVYGASDSGDGSWQFGICNADGSYRLAANTIKAFIAAHPD